MKNLLTHKIWFLIGLVMILVGGLLLFFEFISLTISIIIGSLGVFIMASSKFRVLD